MRRLITLFLIPLLAGIGLGAEELQVTPIAEVRAWPPDDLARSLPVRLPGVVTFRGADTFVIQDESAGIYVNLGLARQRGIWRGDNAAAARVRPGMMVEIDALTDRGGFSPPMQPRTLRIVGQAQLPAPRPMDPARFFSGVEDCQRIEVCAVVQGGERETDVTTLVLDANPGVFLAVAPNTLVPDLAALVDAEVRLTGVALTKFNTRGEYLLPRLSIDTPAGLTIERTAPSAPFEAPKVPLKSIAGFRVAPPRWPQHPR